MSMPRANKMPRRRYYARYLAHYTQKNLRMLVFGVLFIVGILLGTLLLRSAGEETVLLLERLVGGFVDRRRDVSLYETFRSALYSPVLFVAVLFVCGFCAIAQPIILAAPLIRGLGFGFSAASLFARYGLSALGFVGVLLLPGMVVSALAIFLSCQQALRLSQSFFALMRPGSKGGEGISMREYLLGFATVLLICLAGAFLEGVLYYLFANSLLLG